MKYRVKYLGNKASINMYGYELKANVFTTIEVDSNMADTKALAYQEVVFGKLSNNRFFEVQVPSKAKSAPVVEAKSAKKAKSAPVVEGKDSVVVDSTEL